MKILKMIKTVVAWKFKKPTRWGLIKFYWKWHHL